MLKLIAPKVMLSCEKAWFESSGIPSIRVMERAATCLAESIMDRYGDSRRIMFACGPGGNGGDGYACARILQSHTDMECAIVRSAAPASPDCVENAKLAIEAGIPVYDAENIDEIPAPEIWVDCLYGTGLTRAPEGVSADIIRRINRDRSMGARIVSCDIPSGLNGLTGKAFSACVHADVTVALQYAKYGHFLEDGPDVCGEIDIPDIGFPEYAFPVDLPVLVELEDISRCFTPRKRNVHKNDCGHLLIVAGSFGMAGAAAMCARAALRSGVGLVTCACPASIVPILQTLVPCAMCIPLPEENGAVAAAAIPVIREAMKGKSAIAVGCGWSRRAFSGVLKVILESDIPTVIDADALNILSEHGNLRDLLRAHHILTPHPGEAARLTGHRIEDPMNDTIDLTGNGCAVVLKGDSRVIRGGNECYISTTGCCGMARGGSGDILTGLMGGLLAGNRDCSPALIAACACEIHGVAGVLAQEKFGPRGMNAADMIDFIPEALNRYVDRI